MNHEVAKALDDWPRLIRQGGPRSKFVDVDTLRAVLAHIHELHSAARAAYDFLAEAADEDTPTMERLWDALPHPVWVRWRSVKHRDGRRASGVGWNESLWHIWPCTAGRS